MPCLAASLQSAENALKNFPKTYPFTMTSKVKNFKISLLQGPPEVE